MSTSRKSKGRKPDLAQYDRLKDFQGRKYMGVRVGRGHVWNYEAGEWKETKVTPDKWTFTFNVGKRRRGNAPEGSGAPVGTEYHWYIIANQTVKKLDANNYKTEMSGAKYKVAFKRADKDKWSATDQTQRRYMIKILQGVIKELEAEPNTESPEAALGTDRAAPKPERKSRQTKLAVASH